MQSIQVPVTVASGPSGSVRRWASALLVFVALLVPCIGWAQSGNGNGNGGNSSGGQGICWECEPGDPPTAETTDAQFIQQTVPATMLPGQSYPVSLTFKNIGTKAWSTAEGFKLGSQNPADNTLWGLGRVALPASVAAGQSVTFNFTVKAPTTWGTYNFQWRMLREGVAWFGSLSPNVTILVEVPNTPPTVQLTSPASSGSAYAPTTVSLAATATDPGGSVVSVSFWSNGLLLGTDSSAPFGMTLSGVLSGTYEYLAIATDNRGATATSTAANLSVTQAAGTGARATRTYVYDTNQRLCKTINPESGATVVDYDAAGNVSWIAEGTSLLTNSCDRWKVTDAEKVFRDYDELNRIRRVRTPGGLADLVTDYHPDGQIKSLEANNPGNLKVTTTYEYNKRRLLSGESSRNASTLFTLGYRYDVNGFLAALTYPDGQVVEYSPDALGRATRVAALGGTTYASDIQYFPSGAIKQFRYGNDIVHSMETNLRGLPARSLDRYLGSSTTVTALDDSYVFDQNANVKSITDAAQGGLTSRAMSYDGLDRLLTANSPRQWGNASYGYDALDNLRVADQGPRQFRYNYNTLNRLANIKSPAGATLYAFNYDARGNTTSKNAQAYAFDSVNRMNQVTGLQTYRYDGQGRRVQTTDADNKTTFWIYSQSGQVLYTSEARRSQNLSYIYLGNSQIATRAIAWGSGAVSLRYQHTDSLGSPVAETDPLRNIIKRNRYAPYGEAYGTEAIDGTGYTGHVMDRGTGLTYMQQRYYDPVVGRFQSVDSIGVRPGGNNFNRFNYASNHPYKFTDPDGRDSSCFITRVGCSIRPKTAEENQQASVAFVGLVATTLTAGTAGPAAAAAAGQVAQFGLAGAILSNPVSVRVAAYLGLELTAGVASGGGAPSPTLAPIASRAAAISGVLDPIAQSRRTTAVLSTNGPRIAASGGRDLSPAQRRELVAGEVPARSPRTHAEVTALQHAAANGLQPVEMAATRPFCAACADYIEQSGGQITGPTTATW